MFGPGHGFGIRPHRPPSDAPPVGIVQSAAIEADGTVLALVLAGAEAGSWADYGIASVADLMAGVSLATTTAGFDRSGGEAVANAARARPIVALRPCRRLPIEPGDTSTPNADILDEADNGDGTFTVRLRLSQHVYQGDSCTLLLASGWRAGAPAQAGVAVTNDSELAAAPVVGGRWLTVPKQRVIGAFRVDVMAGSVNPEGREGLCAVRFDVTDGTTTKTVWATALSTSTEYGDSVRCWGATIDPGGLTAGSSRSTRRFIHGSAKRGPRAAAREPRRRAL